MPMSTDTLNVLIGGEAGQGLVTVGQLLSKALVRAGWRICVTQEYQSRVRGGHNTWAIRVGAAEPSAPEEDVDLLVALDQESVALHRGAVVAGGLLVADEAVDPLGLKALRVPFGKLASARHENVAALGVAGTLLGLTEGLLAAVTEELFGHKATDDVAENRRALAESCRWAAGSGASLPIPGQPSLPGARAMMNGNEAIAFGALSAGLRLLSFYPMTPATSIALTVAASAPELAWWSSRPRTRSRR